MVSRSILRTLIPTLTDPTMAPPGKHTCLCLFSMLHQKSATGEWTDKDREGFGKTVMIKLVNTVQTLRLHCSCRIRSPQDIENEGLTEGNIFQGELTMDQMFFNRPFPGYSQFRGPVKVSICADRVHHPGGVYGCNQVPMPRDSLILNEKI